MNWSWITFLFAGRFLSSAVFFMYVGTLPFILSLWGLTATEAGIIQTGSVVGFGLALSISTYLSDFKNPSQILIFFSITNCLFAFLFALLASDFISALILNFFLGLSQGGIYGPSMILVSEKYVPANRGKAMGLNIAGQSFGYGISLGLSFVLANLYSLQTAFLTCSILTVLGLIIFLAGLWKDLSKKYHFKKSIFKFDKKDDNKKNLIVSYSAHSVELFGMWAWLPVFLSIILLDIAELSPVVIGLLVGVVLHFSGFIANMIAGTLSDRLGRRFIMVLFALSSGLISFLIGWIVDWNWMIILIISILYSFFCIGDSSVLTASLTENTSRSVLGRALAFRSIIGIGLASITPAIFGYILDLSNNHQPIDTSTNWVYAFSFLGISGLIATYFAYKTKTKRI